ncbi:hypothetical protein ABK040_013302 [Willaertia magna]
MSDKPVNIVNNNNNNEQLASIDTSDNNTQCITIVDNNNELSFSSDDESKDEQQQVKQQQTETQNTLISEKKKMEKKIIENVEKNNLQKILEALQSNDINLQLDGAVQVRKLLSMEKNPPIDDVLESGILPILVNFLSFNAQPLLQFESVWAITNIASGKSFHTETVVNSGVVPTLIKLLQSPCDDVVEQSIWALGNIAGDSSKFRDYVLKLGALQPLLQIIANNPKITILRNAAWTLSNFCRGKPAPEKSLVSPSLPVLAHLLYHSDEEIVCDTTWALSYYSDGTNDKIQDVIDSGVCRRLIELLLHRSNSIVTPALRTVGNIVTGDDLQTQIVINMGVLPSLQHLLSSSKTSIRKETCWMISNIVGGSRSQIQSVIDSNIIPSILKLISKNGEDTNVKKEAMWIMNNLFAGGSKEQIDYAIKLECMITIIDLLENSKDVKILGIVLESMKSLLKAGNDFRNNNSVNPYIECIEGCDGFEKVRLFSNHHSFDITSLVSEILDFKNDE